MTSLGFGGDTWRHVLTQRGPELALAVMETVPTVRDLTLDTDGDWLVAAGRARGNDHYGTAWAVTEALTDVWCTLVEDAAGLRITVGTLRVDVPAEYFAERILTRRRWATHARTMLVHDTPS